MALHTGAAGMLDSGLVSAPAREGVEGHDRDLRPNMAPDLLPGGFHRHDVRLSGEVKSHLDLAREIVFHLAAETDMESARAILTEPLREMLSPARTLCPHARRRVWRLSKSATAGVFDGTKEEPTWNSMSKPNQCLRELQACRLAS